VRYIAIRPPQTALRKRIREIAEVRVSYGYRRITVLLRREGWHVNAKRTYRLYKEDGLDLRRKRPKRRRSAVARQPRVAVTRPNERWSMDFMSDALANGQKLRVLTAVDQHTRECVALEVGNHFRDQDVAAILTRVGFNTWFGSTGTRRATGHSLVVPVVARPPQPIEAESEAPPRMLVHEGRQSRDYPRIALPPRPRRPIPRRPRQPDRPARGRRPGPGHSLRNFIRLWPPRMSAPADMASAQLDAGRAIAPSQFHIASGLGCSHEG
jgi:hypothetical protein